MKKITKTELDEILRLHKLWLAGDPLGVRADLRDIDLHDIDLRGADLSCADLSYANLRGADLSGTKGLVIPSEYIAQHFERVKDGYIGYKTFGGKFPPPDSWVIKPGEIITETVNPNRTDDCGSGINIAPLDWVKGRYKGDIWQVLIRWEWLADVVVPYNTDGKIRCGKAELVKIVDRG